jgi:hypothetical protein
MDANDEATIRQIVREELEAVLRSILESEEDKKRAERWLIACASKRDPV